MKVGIYNSVKDVPGRGKNLPTIMDEVIEEAVLAEEMGFDCMFLGSTTWTRRVKSFLHPWLPPR